jgi:hypothetical protein
MSVQTAIQPTPLTAEGPLERMILIQMTAYPSTMPDEDRRELAIKALGFDIPALLDGHRTALETMIETNARADVNRVTQIILDGLDGQARKYLRLIARHEADPDRTPYGTRGALGENGAAPAIRDIVSRAERHRARQSSDHRKAA